MSMARIIGHDGHSDPETAGDRACFHCGTFHPRVKGRRFYLCPDRGRWRFDAIEDLAVYQMLSFWRRPYADGPMTRRLFWQKYAPAREAFVGAYFLCLKWGRSPADLVCVLHG